MKELNRRSAYKSFTRVTNALTYLWVEMRCRHMLLKCTRKSNVQIVSTVTARQWSSSICLKFTGSSNVQIVVTVTITMIRYRHILLKFTGSPRSSRVQKFQLEIPRNSNVQKFQLEIPRNSNVQIVASVTIVRK